jgi:hypothetical protein
MKFYIPQNPLRADQTILFKLGQLGYEDLNVRKKRFTLINLFTNHRYNKNTVIARLVDKAYEFERRHLEDWAKQSLNDASTLLERAKLEAPTLSKYRFIRWLKGTPRINIADLEARINRARQIMDFEAPAPVQPQPADPVPVKPKPPLVVPYDLQQARQKALDSLTLTKQQTIDILKEAHKECPANTSHVEVLRKWISVAERQDEVIANYDRKKAKKGRGFLYSDPVAHIPFHGEIEGQDPAIQIYKGLEAYALIYQRIGPDKGLKESFFKEGLSDYTPCFDGNYGILMDWARKNFNKSQDLVLNIDQNKNKFINLGELNRVFDAHQFRSYFVKHYYSEYEEFDEWQRRVHDQYFNIGKATSKMQKHREETTTQDNFVAFIREQKCLPLQCLDVTLTEENLEAEVKEYFEAVF